MCGDFAGWCWEPYYGEIKVWDEEAEEGGDLRHGCVGNIWGSKG